MIELFDRAHVLTEEIHKLHSLGKPIPQEALDDLRHLMNILKGYSVMQA
jgi:hypothetical protein